MKSQSSARKDMAGGKKQEQGARAARKRALEARHAAFAERFNKACDENSNVPPLRFGRLTWIRDEMEKMGHPVLVETIRKWSAGMIEPRPPKMEALAEVLRVDLLWLQTGVDPNLTPRERRARNAMADGVVNLVAGLIRMDGATPVFPTDDDRLADRENVDIYATIKAIQYRFHVTLAEREGKALKFTLPTRVENTMVIGVERVEEFTFRLYEIPSEMIEQDGVRRGGSMELAVDAPEKSLKPIHSFADRL